MSKRWDHLRKARKDAEKRVQKIDSEISRLTEEARKLILSSPPDTIHEFAQRLAEQEEELKKLEAAPSPDQEAIKAKRAEVDEARRTVIFIQETVLSFLPKPIEPPRGQKRGR